MTHLCVKSELSTLSSAKRKKVILKLKKNRVHRDMASYYLQSKFGGLFFDKEFSYQLWWVILRHIWREASVPHSCLISNWAMQIQDTVLSKIMQVTLHRLYPSFPVLYALFCTSSAKKCLVSPTPLRGTADVWFSLGHNVLDEVMSRNFKASKTQWQS